MSSVDAQPARLSAARPKWLIPAIVASTVFMENLDSTVIATVLPTLARSFGEAPADLNIGITAYMLTLALCIPISAWVADRFGTRSVFLTAICLFVAASLLCGASDSLAAFTAARVLQGVGGAMMVPVGRMIILRTTSKAELMAAMATITWPALIAPVIGPSLGGWIATYASWRWIFYMNLPIGMLAFVLVWRFVPNLQPDGRRPFDGPGFALTSAAILALMSGLVLVSSGHALLGWPALSIALAAGLGALTVRYMRRAAHPLLNLRPFRVPTFAETVLAGSFSRFAVAGGLFLLPLMFQIGFGMSPFAAGSLMLIGAVGSLSTKAIAIGVVRRFGFRSVLRVNSALIALATLACALLTPDMPLAGMGLVLLSCGFTRSLQFTCLNTLAFADLPPEQISAASMLTSMLQPLVMALAVAVSALGLQLSAHLRSGNAGELALIDFRLALFALVAVAMVAAVRFGRLRTDAGAELSGRGAPA